MREKSWGRIFMDAEKSLLRAEGRSLRDRLSESFRTQASERILEFLLGCREYQCVRQIFLFCTLGSEPQTASWMERFWRDGKSVSCPRTQEKRRMDFYEIQRKEDLLPGRYGILEPAEACLGSIPDADTWILTPGLWFDDRGYRIGYGGGFYDRYMERFPMAHYIGVGFACQRRSEGWPLGPFDRRLERLVTEQGVYFFEEVGE